MPSTLERVQSIFQDVLEQPELVVTRGDSGKTVEAWDSLAHISIIASVEGEFGVRFALGELEELKNIGDMLDLIELKLARQ